MDNFSDVERYLNVVNLVDFKNSYEDIPSEILHPASIHFPEEDDDFSNIEKTNSYEYKLNFTERPKVMLSKIERQVKAIREKSQRIKYYLDEMKL